MAAEVHVHVLIRISLNVVQDKDFPYLDFSTCEDNYSDPVLVKVLKKQGQWVTKVCLWKLQARVHGGLQLWAEALFW